MVGRLQSGVFRDEGLAHGFFTRAGGVSSGIYATLNGGVGSRDESAAVLENRRRMAETLGVSHLMVPYQVHSVDVVTLNAPFLPDERPKADGLVTATRGLALGATGADCGMILFADQRVGVIGACHAGWKGTLNDIVGAVVKAMVGLGAQPAHISAVLGPCIQQKSYEVGPEFFAHFIEKNSNFVHFFTNSTRQNHYHFDMPGMIEQRAREAGIGRFESLGLDTYADPERFYSYRRSVHRGEPDYGRLISAIALV